MLTQKCHCDVIRFDYLLWCQAMHKWVTFKWKLNCLWIIHKKRSALTQNNGKCDDWILRLWWSFSIKISSTSRTIYIVRNARYEFRIEKTLLCMLLVWCCGTKKHHIKDKTMLIRHGCISWWQVPNARPATAKLLTSLTAPLAAGVKGTRGKLATTCEYGTL